LALLRLVLLSSPRHTPRLDHRARRRAAVRTPPLIVWNKAFLRYDLTTFGQNRLAVFGRERPELVR
jgi:hypothetical protein